jgi:putative transposase
MRKSKFIDSQFMDAVKRVEGGFGVPYICRELGICTATFYKWRAKYGGMDVSILSRMKELEEENRRLKKMYLEEKLKAEIVSEALEKSGEAIPTYGDGHQSSQGARHLHSGGLPGL